MQKRSIISIGIFLMSLTFSFGQMNIGQETRYGNEWIDYEKDYYKVLVGRDGMFRITYETLLGAGFPIGAISGNQLQLFFLGEEIPIYTSTDNLFGSGDYIEFFGEQNRSQVDRHLFDDPANEMLNPLYSLVTDSSGYFLTWSSDTNLRYQSINNDLTNLPPKTPYFWYEETLNFTDKLSKFANPAGVKNSHFQAGEGYSTGFLTNHNITISPQNIFPTNELAELKVRLATNERNHQLVISVNGTEVANETYYGYELKQYNFPVMLSENNSAVNLETKGINHSNDRQAISNVILRYPRNFNFNDQSEFLFTLSDNTSAQYLEIENFQTANGTIVLYDLTNNLRILPTLENGILKIALPPSNNPDRRLLLTHSTSGTSDVSTVNKVDFINYDDQEGDYIIITDAILNSGSNNMVKAYSDYRRSFDGGGFNPVIVDVQQLYDQFAYGINRHYISIRNFGHYIKTNWSNPRYVFIIGKGMEADQIRTPDKVAKYQGKIFHVPTFGNPGADNLLLSSYDKAKPVIPIGRIASETADELTIYLDKIKAFEANRRLPQTIEDRFWMKKILHLGGGDRAIQNTIKRNLEYIESIIETNNFAADVTAFYKSSTDVIEVSRAEQLFDEINGGLSIITFYGHSGASSFDFNIDDPANYKNKDKYPIFLSLGCYSGQIHNNFKGISERFVFSENSGSIAFFASTGAGYVSALRIAGSSFYESLGGVDYGKGLGDVMQTMLAQLDTIPFLGIAELAAQYTLHGDPAIVLNAHEGPDITIDPKSVEFTPSVIDLQTDSFSISFDLFNLGSKPNEPIPIKLTQEFPNGEIITLKLDTVFFFGSKKEVTLSLPTQGTRALGLNTIYLEIDPDNQIKEQPSSSAESNNELVANTGEKGVKLFFIDNSINPIYPKDFGILNNPSKSLFASTSNPLAPIIKYLFEIDTTESFNSPILNRLEKEQSGGVVEWQPTIPFMDNVVYYWRVSTDSLNEAVTYNWKKSSFTYIEESPDGWSQGHYHQFLKDSLYSLKVLPGNQFNFAATPRSFAINNKIYDRSTPPRGLVEGSSWSDFFRWDIPGSLSLVIFGPDGEIWFNPKPGDYGSVNRTAARIGCYPFPVNTRENRAQLIDFLENVVPEASTIFAYTALRNENIHLNVNDWRLDSLELDGKNLFNVFEKYGAENIRNLETNMVPWGIAFTKSQGVIDEKIATDITEEFTLEHFIPLTRESGEIFSTLIGPVDSWNSIQLNLNSVDADVSTDSTELTLWGYSKPDVAPNLLMTYPNMTSNTDISWIDANEYPYLQLQLKSFDADNKTAPDINHWTVLYEGIPELAVNPDRYFVVTNDSIEKGQQYSIELAIENISDYDPDSILVKYLLTSEQSNLPPEFQRIAPITQKSFKLAKYSINTNELNENQSILIEVNPNDDQPELYHFNNFLQQPFTVNADKRNPVLDVTFDGLHIMNGDLVSAKPSIEVSLIDENRFLSLADTSELTIFIKHPDGTTNQILREDQDVTLDFEPEKNRISLFINREFAESGLYELLVNGQDASQNLSGQFGYKIEFKIITEQSVSNLLNYPNPFSTSTQFVYTLTGSTVPADYKIQIFSASGRIVREIDQTELGPLKIGTHRTEYVWDGRDDYGDQLANGVYFYKLVAKDEEGLDLKIYEGNGINQFFKNGYSKLVILR